MRTKLREEVERFMSVNDAVDLAVAQSSASGAPGGATAFLANPPRLADRDVGPLSTS